MKIISVVGARPNFMKVAPFIKAIKTYNDTLGDGTIEHLLVHTGQHYDVRMSESFFEALQIPNPDINLNIGSGSHAEQVGHTMIAFEKVCLEHKPDWVIVIGDVNATLACSVTAKKLHIKVCHIEAGLRSGDIEMPEEINRLVTDRLSDLLLIPDRLSEKNLLREGANKDSIVMVGNIMIDTLDANQDKAGALSLDGVIADNKHEACIQSISLKDDNYTVLTMHRPSNVDDPKILEEIVDFIINDIATIMPVVWTVHPRTEKQLKNFGLWDNILNCTTIQLLYPLGYHEMLRLNQGAKIMLTDSGGLQEECTVLGTRCLTMRWNTERPVTLKENGGASILVGNDVERMRHEFEVILKENTISLRPEMWDGKTAMRCVKAIVAASE